MMRTIIARGQYSPKDKSYKYAMDIYLTTKLY